MKARRRFDFEPETVAATTTRPDAPTRQTGVRVRAPVLSFDGEHAALVQARAQASHMLAELALVLSEDLDYRTTIRRVVRVLGTRLADACIVDIAGRDGLRIAHAPSLVEPSLSTVLRPLAMSVHADGTPLTPGCEAADVAAQRVGATSLLVVPLVLDDTSLGTIMFVGSADRPLAITVDEASALGRRIATAIRNGRLYEAAVAEAKMRENVMSMVSHDLKNPLGVVLICASRMLESPLPREMGDAYRSVELMQRAAQRMRRLVHDLLDLAALDGGALTMRPASCDAAAIARESVEAMRPVGAEMDVTVRVKDTHAPVPIFADPERIHQVLSNLLGNAIKFTPPGGSVVVAVTQVGDMVAFTVADTGAGIPPTELPRVFDRFWQSKSSAKLGSGLGLAICKLLVELSGGSISVASELGAGTAVTFTVPCRAVCDRASAVRLANA